MSIKRIQTGLRLEEEALAKITFIAKRQKRSFNNQIEFLVQQCIESYEAENGTIPINQEID
ncbi:MAG: Arc family DNA-binding protein [Defluviitaleaceae bacterium]|nr:Arc family DNA-binding protein [Defluviitaleaceae bacterium]